MKQGINTGSRWDESHTRHPRGLRSFTTVKRPQSPLDPDNVHISGCLVKSGLLQLPATPSAQLVAGGDHYQKACRAKAPFVGWQPFFYLSLCLQRGFSLLLSKSCGQYVWEKEQLGPC